MKYYFLLFTLLKETTSYNHIGQYDGTPGTCVGGKERDLTWWRTDQFLNVSWWYEKREL